jgi:hypothetical protein
MAQTAQTMNSNTLPQYTDLIRRNFKKTQELMPRIMLTSGMVVKDPMAMNTGEFKRYAERLHIDQYATTRDEGDTSNQATVVYGYEKDLQIRTISKEISITERMRSAGKDQDIIDSITKLSNTCLDTIDLDLTHRLTFAHDTSYTDIKGDTVTTTVGDGLAWASAAHTLTGSATTYNNIITGNPQFSKGALENAKKLAVEESYNNLGEKVTINCDILFSTDDENTCNQIKELLNSTADVSSDNSGSFNVYSNALRHVKLPRLATTALGAIDSNKTKFWGIFSSSESDFYYSELKAPYLKTPMDGNNGEDFSSENWNYLAAATYGITVVTGRALKISKGDGS